MAAPTIDPAETFRRGLRACREGNWREGHTELTKLAQQEEGRGKLPAIFYSYLGQAMARCEGRRRDGLDLCLHAVEEEPFRPENYLNLAEVYLLLRNKRGALRALDQGMLLDSTHDGLTRVAAQLGLRRRPAFPLLARNHPVNRYLGILSSKLRSAGGRQSTQHDDADDYWETAHRRAPKASSSHS